MSEDSAEFDVGPTELLSNTQLGGPVHTDNMDVPTEMLKTAVINEESRDEYLEADANTEALVRQCPRCALMFSADYDDCPVDGSPLEPLGQALGGSLYDSEASQDGTEVGPTTTFDPTGVMPREELGVADDETIRGTALDGRYFVEDLIGEGGMGRVYRGLQLSVGRTVAIKVLHGRISGDASIRERFNREARLVSAFSHPNTVRLIDFGESAGHLYMVMEFVDGISLQRFAGRGPLNISFALEVLRQVCGPLSEAHKNDITHRDLKPENIFLTRTPDGRLQVKLLDFGVAHIDPSSTEDEADTYRELTRQGVVVGTPEYMAPEQARGEAVSNLTDIYSMGVILYQLISGRLPFTGQTTMHTMFQLVTKPVPPITSHVPDCPLPLVELIERLLQKDPARRLRNVVELARRIREVQMALSLRPLGELEEGDLKTVLEGFMFKDTAMPARTTKYERPSALGPGGVGDPPAGAPIPAMKLPHPGDGAPAIQGQGAPQSIPGVALEKVGESKPYLPDSAAQKPFVPDGDSNPVFFSDGSDNASAGSVDPEANTHRKEPAVDPNVFAGGAPNPGIAAPAHDGPTDQTPMQQRPAPAQHAPALVQQSEPSHAPAQMGPAGGLAQGSSPGLVERSAPNAGPQPHPVAPHGVAPHPGQNPYPPTAEVGRLQHPPHQARATLPRNEPTTIGPVRPYVPPEVDTLDARAGSRNRIIIAAVALLVFVTFVMFAFFAILK